MSDVGNLVLADLVAGDGYVNAKELDAVIAAWQNQLNTLIVAMSAIREVGGAFQADSVRWRNFSTRCRGAIQEMIHDIKTLVEASADRVANYPAPDGGPYVLIQGTNEEPYYSGVTATSKSWTFAVPGDAQSRFSARLRIRHVSQRTPFGLPSVDGTNPYFPLLRYDTTVQPGGVDEDRMFGEAAGMIALPGGVTLDGMIASSDSVDFVGTAEFGIATVVQSGSLNKTWMVNAKFAEATDADLLTDLDEPILTDNDEAITVGAEVQEDQFRPIPFDEILEMTVRGGDTITIAYDVPTGDAAFSGHADYEADTDERFPYSPRPRAAAAFQFDWLSLRAS